MFGHKLIIPSHPFETCKTRLKNVRNGSWCEEPITEHSFMFVRQMKNVAPVTVLQGSRKQTNGFYFFISSEIIKIRDMRN